jgi:hypothetical protein
MHLLSGRAVTPFSSHPAGSSTLRTSCAAAASALLALTLGVAMPAAAQIAKTVEGPKVVPFDLNIDLRQLPKLPGTAAVPKLYRPLLKGPQGARSGGGAAQPEVPGGAPGPRLPMPGTIQNFPGVSFIDNCGGSTCGGGWPPDPNGEVGPNHFIQAVNVGYAIYNKTGTLLTAFQEDQLFTGVAGSLYGSSQGDGRRLRPIGRPLDPCRTLRSTLWPARSSNHCSVKTTIRSRAAGGSTRCGWIRAAPDFRR